MSIDITSFTHISSLGGGMLIGLAAAVLMIFGGVLLELAAYSVAC